MAHWGGEENELDRRNQARSVNLANKVSKLKSIAVDLEHESYEHNRLLDGIDSDMGTGDSLLNLSMKRLQLVLTGGSKNRKATCYTIIGVVLTVILLCYVLSRVGSGNISNEKVTENSTL